MPARTIRRRVLLVEDEPAVHRVLKGLLISMGFDVVSALRGSEAMELAAEEPLDLAIVDKDLPDVQGTTVIRHLRRRHAGLPMIFMTGCPTKESILLAAKLGVVSYLEKPFSSQELEKSLRTALAENPSTGDA